MRRLLIVGLTAALTFAPAPAHGADVSRIGKVFYEPQRQVIVVPFVGTPPNATYFRLTGTRHYWEFYGARLADGAVQHHPIGGDIKRYTVAPRGPSVVRLAIELAIEAKPALRFDARGHRFEIYPFGQELKSQEPLVRVPRSLPLPTPTPPPPPPPTPEPSWRPAPLLRVPRGLTLPLPSPATSLGRPEAGDGGLLMPYEGPAPDFRVRVFTANPRWLYFEFDRTALSLVGKRFGVVDDPFIDAWMFTAPAPGKVRLYLRLRRTTPIVAQVLEPEGRIRFAASEARGGPGQPASQAPSPAAPVPPGSPTPTPAAPVPAGSPAPPPPTEPGESLPEGAGPLLFPRPDSAD